MSGSSPPPLRLFLDRCTQGTRFVAEIRRLVADVETINDRYGVRPAERVRDPTWIADATRAGRILLGADQNILRNRFERHAVCRNAARYILYGNGNMPISMMVELFAANLPYIRNLTAVEGPWVYRIAQHGIDRRHLNCSDLEW
jgi:hypothetical protein